MNIWRYILICAIIFFFERILPFFIPFSTSIFPVFAIYLLIISQNYGQDLIRLIVASVFFDVFSGLPFGYFTLALIIVSWLIYLAKRQLKIGRNSFISSAFFLIIFSVSYLAMFASQIPILSIVSKLPAIVGQYAIAFAILYFFKHKLKFYHR